MVDARLKGALALFQQGRVQDAWEAAAPLLQPAPTDFDSLNILGTIALQAGQAAQGVDLLQRAVAQHADVARTHLNLGSGLQKLGRFEDAVVSYDRAIALKPTLADAHNNRGAALAELKRHDDALASYGKALAREPNNAEAHFNRAVALRQLARPDEALAAYDRAIALQPDNAKAHNGRGLVLQDLKRMSEALASFDRATALAPTLVAAHDARGAALFLLRRLDEALAAYDTSLTLAPTSADIHSRRAEVLRLLNRPDEAIASYDKALAFDPNLTFVAGMRLYTRMKICDWRGIEDDIADVMTRVARGEKTSPPLPFLAVCDRPEVQRICAETWTNALQPTEHILPAPPQYPRHDKIRIGYFSSDLFDHATAYLMAECFERHDASAFDVTAFSFGPDRGDAMQRRLRGAFARFIDVQEKSDIAVAQLARDMEIDIAVDLKGLTHDARPRIFALRAAPMQVSYLGYPGTLGADYIDYLIADPVLIQPQDRPHYMEKIVTLPDTYQANDTQRAISNRAFTRAEVSLPAQGFVFCCFNSNYKILPAVFGSWMRILRQIDGAVLWLLQDNPGAARHLREEAMRHGIDPTRLVFASHMPLADHLARQRLADLFLDTTPYNAHTTASDALWVGLPVLTVAGHTFAGRVAESLLRAIALPELVAASLADYEALAIRLARDENALRALRDRLHANRSTAPLFDSARFTRALEAAYTAIYARYRAQLPPDHIAIARSPF